MAPINLILGFSYIFLAILLILVSIPLQRGAIGMNRFYGVRFKKSFESDDNWYKINKYSAGKIILWSWLLLAAGVVILLIPADDNDVLIGLMTFCPLVLLLPPVISGYRFARRL
jgi:hypothetical protein